MAAATTEPAVKEKPTANRTRKGLGGLRGRFLLSAHQAVSLDSNGSSSSQVQQGSTGSSSPSSRMKRLLMFRRTRSEQTPSSPRPVPSVEDPFPFDDPSTVIAPVHRPIGPHSPPPPYDNQSEVYNTKDEDKRHRESIFFYFLGRQTDSVRSGSICPPTYDEVMAQTAAHYSSRSTHCTCRECLVGNSLRLIKQVELYIFKKICTGQIRPGGRGPATRRGGQQSMRRCSFPHGDACSHARGAGRWNGLLRRHVKKLLPSKKSFF